MLLVVNDPNDLRDVPGVPVSLPDWVTVAGVVIRCFCLCASSRTGSLRRSRCAMRATRYPMWPVLSNSKPDCAARNLGPGLLSSPKRREGSRVLPGKSPR